MIEFNGVANDPLMSSKFKKRQLKTGKNRQTAAVTKKYEMIRSANSVKLTVDEKYRR